MPSPFPGMDPWLEREFAFSGLQPSLIFLIEEALNAVLPEDMFASGNRRCWAEPVSQKRTIFIAEPWEQSYLEIRNADDERLVTALEILSPKNKKPGDSGREAYLQKQAEFRRGGVHLVEIDLLRGGTHTTGIPLRDLKRVKAEFDYHHCVTVCGERTRFEVNAYSLKDPIPPVVIPLDPGVRPIRIELQPLFDRTYDTGRSHLSAKYAKRIPEPPLTEEQSVWAEGRIAGATGKIT